MATTNSFPARFPFECAKCKATGDVGAPIRWDRTKKNAIYHEACYNELKGAQPVENAPMPENNGNGGDGGALMQLAKALNPYIKGALEFDASTIKDMVAGMVAEMASPVTIVKIEQSGKPPKEIKGVHQKFERLLYLIGKRHHVYLYGAPGSGKSTAAKQCADALELPFGYISLNPQTPESRLIGYMDAGGNYRSTVFHDIYTKGGVFCIDEQDNASPALLTTLNSLLENGHGAFPHGIFERHKDFILVSTGNTNGRGGNAMFPERRPFDGAFAERFSFLSWEYDENLEKSIAAAINSKASGKDWLAWIKAVRLHCAVHHPKVLVSPRATFKGASYLIDGKMSADDIAHAVLWKGLDQDTISKIKNACPFEGALS